MGESWRAGQKWAQPRGTHNLSASARHKGRRSCRATPGQTVQAMSAETRPWEPEEDLIVMEMIQRGHMWKAIVPLLPGRTAAGIRNRWARVRLGREGVDESTRVCRCRACGQPRRGHICTARMPFDAAIPLHDSWFEGVSLIELMDFACGEGLFGQGALEEGRGATGEDPSVSPAAPPPTSPPDGVPDQEGAGLLSDGVQEQVRPMVQPGREEEGLVTPAVLRESNTPPAQPQPRRKRSVPRLDTFEVSTRQRSRVEVEVKKGVAWHEHEGELLLDGELGELLRFAEDAIASPQA